MRYCILISLFTASLLLPGCKQDKEITRNTLPVKVKVLDLSNSANAYSSITYSGTVAANKTIDLSFQVSGTLLTMPVEIGDYVTKGQLIAQIDETTYRSQYAAQQAQARLAGENYRRIQEVYKKGSIAEIKMLEARAQHEQATASAKAIYQNLAHTKIYAPASGYVGSKQVEVGNTLSPGTPVVQLLDISTVKVNVPVPEAEINQHKTGDAATVIIPSLNTQVSGRVAEVGVIAPEGSPVYTAKIVLGNKDNLLKPGMVANVLFDKAGGGNLAKENNANQIVVPLQAVQVDEMGNNYVFVASADGKTAQQKKVTTGTLYNDAIAITSGITAQDKLIISGYHKLTDKSLIEVIK